MVRKKESNQMFKTYSRQVSFMQNDEWEEKTKGPQRKT